MKAQSNFEGMNKYSINIDIFRKGTYKIYSIRIENREFEAIRHSTVKHSSVRIEKKILNSEEAKDIEHILSSLSIDALQDEYINKGVKGEHHLIYQITKDETQKEIYVYFEDQAELKQLYNKLMLLVPEDDRIWYYR